MVPCFPLLGLTPSGLFMGLSSTFIYTSELILSSTASFEQHKLVEKIDYNLICNDKQEIVVNKNCHYWSVRNIFEVR